MDIWLSGEYALLRVLKSDSREVKVSRFQALTNPVLDQELEELRQELGLRENQKAELLRELSGIASWVLLQSRAGRRIEARGPSGTEVLQHPLVSSRLMRIVLTEEEVSQLERLLTGEMPEALKQTLERIATRPKAPAVRWPDADGP